MDTITIGKHNPRLADIRKAVHRGSLTSDGLLPVEGPKLILEAYASGIPIKAVFLRDGVESPELPPALTTYLLEPAVFKGIQTTEHSQGVIALVRPRSWTLDDVLGKGSDPVIILAALQDPGNVGTILRVAESFGAAACIGLSGTARVHNPKVIRASAGSVFRLPHVWDLDWETLVEEVQTRGIPLLGASPSATNSITSWDWSQGGAVLIGNEGAGLTAAQARACVKLLRIPHEPQTESLNSAIAAAVILYEAYRRRIPS